MPTTHRGGTILTMVDEQRQAQALAVADGWGDEHLANLGAQRAAFMSPMASAFAKGLRCSNHTDFVVTPMEPTRVMWSSIKRTSKTGKVIGPDQTDRHLAGPAVTENRGGLAAVRGRPQGYP